MKKAGVLVSVIATTAVCASLIVGSTFALFTSESKVDITVSSGKVEVSSEVKNAQITHADTIVKNGEEYEATYGENITEVTVNGNSLALEKVIPADIMEFDIVLSNTGSVNANYQYSLKSVEGLKLFSALDVVITDKDGTVYEGANLKSYTSTWGELAVEGNVTYHVALTLPASVGNDYQDVTSKLEVATYAVQYNAAVDKTAEAVVEYVPAGVTVYDVKTVADFEAALNAENAYVALNEDLEITGVTPTSNYVTDYITVNKDTEIDLNGNVWTIDNKLIKVEDGADLVITDGIIVAENTSKNGMADCALNVVGNQSGKQATLTLNNVNVESFGYGIGIKNFRTNDNEPLVTVNGGVISTSHPYACAIGTSALLDSTGSAIYSGGAVVMNDTTINSNGAGIMLTVPVSMELNNCTINSRMQCLVIRGGEVTLNGCTLNNDIYNSEEYASAVEGLTYASGYMSAKYVNNTVTENTSWGASNNTDLAAIVIGNRVASTYTAYKNSAKVTVNDTVINQTNGINASEGALVYIHGDPREYTATFEYSGTQLAETDIVKAGDTDKITVTAK